MEDIADVIVVGAGPAGLMASITAAEQGLKVLLLERKTDIASVRRSCCTALIIEPGTHEEFVALEKGRIIFHRSDFSIPYRGPFIPLKQMIKFSPHGHTFVVERNVDPVAIALNKESLLEDLCAEAQKRGVELVAGANALAVEQGDETVTITVSCEGKTLQRTGKAAIAADGVNSRMVDLLGLNQGRKNFGTMQALTYYLEGVDCPYPPSWIVFVGRGHVPSGKGQIYFLPKPQTDGSSIYELTYGQPAGAGSAMEEDLRWFLEKGRFAPWFKKARIVKTLAAVLKFSTPIPDPRAGRVLMAGDAASYIEVYNQGALMYGYKAGHAVAAFLKRGSSLDEYGVFWRKTFAYNRPGAIEAAVQAFGLHVLEDDEIDYLFSLTAGEKYKGYVNEHSSRETTMGALLSHMEEIKRDRPGLAAKIAKFDQVSTEEFLQVGTRGGEKK